MRNIVLIGFMGVGKGSIAREIVKLSDMIAIDTDDIIESMENRRIKEIFESDGEEYFRALEKKVAEWLKNSVKSTLISTGGGFYKQKSLNKIGTVILLDAPFDVIYNRIKEHPNAEKKLLKRPLFNDIDKARELYDERHPKYLEVADIVVSVVDKTPKDIAKEILKKVKK